MTCSRNKQLNTNKKPLEKNSSGHFLLENIGAPTFKAAIPLTPNILTTGVTYDPHKVVINDLFKNNINGTFYTPSINHKDPNTKLTAYKITKTLLPKGQVRINIVNASNNNLIAVATCKNNAQIPKLDLLIGNFLPTLQLIDPETGLAILMEDNSIIKGTDFIIGTGTYALNIDKHKGITSFTGKGESNLCMIKGYRPEKIDQAVEEYFSKGLYNNVDRGNYADTIKQDYSLVAMLGGYGTRLTPILDAYNTNKPSTFLPGENYRLMHINILDMGIRSGILSPDKIKTDLNNKNAIKFDTGQVKLTGNNQDTCISSVNGPEDKVMDAGYALVQAFKKGIIPIDKPAVFSTGDFLTNIDLSRTLKEFETSNAGYMAINNVISKDEIKNQMLMGIEQDKNGQWLINKTYEKADTAEKIDALIQNAVIKNGKYAGKFVTSTNCQIVIMHPKVLQILKAMLEQGDEKDLVTFFSSVQKILNGKEKILDSQGQPLKSLVKLGVTDSKGNPLGVKAVDGGQLKMMLSFAETKSGEPAVLTDVGAVNDFIDEIRKVAMDNKKYEGLPKPLIEDINCLVNKDEGIICMSEEAKKSFSIFKDSYGISETKGNILIIKN